MKIIKHISLSLSALVGRLKKRQPAASLLAGGSMTRYGHPDLKAKEEEKK